MSRRESRSAGSASPSGAVMRANGTTLHRQLFLVLREQISAGRYDPKVSLPSEEALCAEYGVSRITVRRALADLEREGVVERRQGKGTYVKAVASTPPLPKLTLLGGLRKVAAETQVEILTVEPRAAPARVATTLGVPQGTDAVYALRLRKKGDVPLMLTEAWLPARFSQAVTRAALLKSPLYKVLLKEGVVFGQVIQEVSAEAADPLRARLLMTDIGAPLLRLTRVLYDATQEPVQYLTIYLSPERSRILMEIPADQLDTLDAGHIEHDLTRV